MNSSGQKAVAALFDKHVWDIYGFIAYRVRSREDAEDLTQQTFERAVRAWHRFDPERASAKTWLVAIARNLVIDHLRRGREQREAAFDDPIEGPGGDDGSFVDPSEDRGVDPDLQAALDRLSDRDREVLALRFGGDMTGPEIAAELEITLANAQQILSRSLRRLRQELENRGSSRHTA